MVGGRARARERDPLFKKESMLSRMDPYLSFSCFSFCALAQTYPVASSTHLSFVLLAQRAKANFEPHPESRGVSKRW